MEVKQMTGRIMTELAAHRALTRLEHARAAGLRIAWMRRQANVSRAELGAYVGVSPSTIARIEHGKRAVRPTERIAIARALGASLAVFIVANGDGNGNGGAR
jgi:transcriptional regulator with XRE-family HTH domain